MKLFLSLISIFLIPQIVSALTITELMYNPEGSDSNREWVEIHNDSGEAKELTASNVRLIRTDGGRNEKRHTIRSDEYSTICENEIVIIAKNVDTFKAEYPSYSGKIFKSAFSFLNSEAYVSIAIDGTELSRFNYSSDNGGNDDGQSLHNHGGVAIANVPGPGSLPNGGYPTIGNCQVASTTETVAETTIQTNSSSSSSSSRRSSSSRTIEEDRREKSEIESGVIVTPSEILVNVENKFYVNLHNKKEETIRKARMVFNFGDGTMISGNTVNHIYKYPGEYAVVAYSENYDFSIQAKIKVEEPNLGIENKGTHIEIKNYHNFDVNLSDWTIETDIAGRPETLFEFPNDSIILANETISIHSQKLRRRASGEVSLHLPKGNKVFAREEEVAETAINEVVQQQPIENTEQAPRPENVVEDRIEKTMPEPISIEDTEEVISNITIDETYTNDSEDDSFPVYIWLLIIILIIIIAISPLIITALQKNKTKIKKLVDEIDIE